MTATTVERAGTGARSGPARPSRVLSHSLTIAWRNLVQVVRSPELLVFSAVQPIMFVLLFTYVFGGAMIPMPGVEYIDFLIPGIVVMTVAFASFGTGIGLNVDLSNGMVDRFRSLPIARSVPPATPRRSTRSASSGSTVIPTIQASAWSTGAVFWVLAVRRYRRIA